MRPSPTPPSGLMTRPDEVVARAAAEPDLPGDATRRAVQTPDQGAPAQPKVQAGLGIVVLLGRQALELSAYVLTLSF